VIGHVVRQIPDSDGPACPRVAVDGPDGSGKTTFADELPSAIRGLDRTVVRFHTDVLEPFAPGGSRRYRPVAHDLATDAVLNPELCTALPGTVLLVDGLFLHRDEIVDVGTLPSSWTSRSA
jgi:uridine kinase